MPFESYVTHGFPHLSFSKTPGLVMSLLGVYPFFQLTPQFPQEPVVSEKHSTPVESATMTFLFEM